MDKTTLESSIQRECDEAIAAIRENEAEEMSRLDVQHQAAIDSFRSRSAGEADARIRQELARLDNKAILERRKLQLAGLEDLISRLVDDVMKHVRSDPRYAPFLLAAVTRALGDIPGNACVRLSPEDMAREHDIRLAAAKNPLTVTADPALSWGGCLVVDEKEGRIFNSTLERIYYRKSAFIRRRVAKIVAQRTQEINGHI